MSRNSPPHWLQREDGGGWVMVRMIFFSPELRRNDGAPGVDGQTFEDIEAYGVHRWLGGVVGTVTVFALVPSGFFLSTTARAQEP